MKEKTELISESEELIERCKKDLARREATMIAFFDMAIAALQSEDIDKETVLKWLHNQRIFVRRTAKGN